MIERTSYGLANEHLFYDVDLMVYCEGNTGDSDTHDEMFWESVLGAFGVKCVCKSRGSKSNIVTLARRAINDNVTNIAFAMDRDYCDYFGFPVIANNVLYTYGYSWENDVLIDIEIDKVFSLFAPTKNRAATIREYEEFHSRIAEDCIEIHKLDVAFYTAPQALFDREKPVSLFTGSGDSLSMNLEKVRTKADSISGHEPYVDANAWAFLDWRVSFFGKAISKLIYNWLYQRSQGIAGKSKVPYDAFIRLCICNLRFDPDARQRDAYYKEIASKISV